MRMQNSCQAHISTQVFGVSAKVFQSAGNACKQKFVNAGLVVEGRGSELIGQGKGHHKVVNRQKFGLLALQPKRGFVILILWAVTVSTGERLP